MRATLRWSGRLSPQLGGAIAQKLFFTPRRLRRPSRETPWLERVSRRFLDVRGQRIAVYEQGEGPAVLVIHGWEGRASQMGPLADAIAARGFRVVTFDGPGHGDSEGNTCDLPALLGVTRVLGEGIIAAQGSLHGLVGHSMGGAVSVLAAADGLVARRGVVIAAPASVRSVVDSFVQRLGLEDGIEADLERRLEARVGADGWWRLSPAMRARQLTHAALIVHDADDQEVAPSEGEALAEAWRGARLLRTQGLGHARILRDPTMLDEIAGFIAGRVEPSASR